MNTCCLDEVDFAAHAGRIQEQTLQAARELMRFAGSDEGSDVHVTAHVYCSDQSYDSREEILQKLADLFATCTVPLILPDHLAGTTFVSPPDFPALTDFSHCGATVADTRIDDRVQATLKEWGLLGDVREAAKLCTKVYRTLKSCEVCISEDPEIDDWTRVILDLKVSGAPETVLEDEKDFRRQLEPAVSNKAFALINVIYEWID